MTTPVQNRYIRDHPESVAIMDYLRANPGSTTRDMVASGVDVPNGTMCRMHHMGLVRPVGVTMKDRCRMWSV